MDAIEMPKRYDPKEAEPRLQKAWLSMKGFKFDPKGKKKIYSIDTPPRYASGILHIGHATSYSHQDFMARFKRMMGFNVFYPLCYDVNGLPIEVNVEKQGILPEKVGREAFIKACSEFAAKNIGTMTEQFRSLGIVMDDSIYYQTDADYYRRLTQISFVRLFKKDLIYKGEAPVNWCPRCATALADAETEYKTRATKLNYLKFYMKEEVRSRSEFLVEDKKGVYAVIATTRPELLPACVVVLVHPDDERYKALIGKHMKVPLFGSEIKVLGDESVDPKFGTGIMMVCTFGDLTDLEVVRRNKLPFIRALDEKGKLTEKAGKYEGLGVKEARKAILEDLKKEGLLTEQEDLQQNVSACWRCSTPIEYIITKEWFLKILPFKDDVLRLGKQIKWYPPYMEQRLKNWTESLAWDWCISRRRYFATPIPVWECDECGEVMLAEEKECYVDPLSITKKCKCGGTGRGTGMVFDTWMDSSLTPLYNAYWERDGKMFKKLFPITLRPQAHDIIRTWAFYSILRSFLLTKEKPFEDVAISSYIMGPDGTPMHASKGNTVDPLEVIEKYSADAFRYFAGLCSLGVDTAFKWKDVEHANRLLQKLWNMSRFAGMHLNDFKPRKVKYSAVDKWILSKAARLVEECTENWNEYNFSAALQKTEQFLWHDLADNYLEIAKSRLYGKDAAARKAAQNALYTALITGVKLIAPILPHVTEEIWQNLFKRFEKEDSLHLSKWPKKSKAEKKVEQAGDLAVAVISAARQWKQSNKLPLNTELAEIVIDAPAKEKKMLEPLLKDITGTTKAKKVSFGKAELPVPGTELKFSLKKV